MNILDINYNLYKSFIATYKHMNISHAADELHLTPSAVCQNIKELEKQLNNIKLFISQPRGVLPTKEADELYNLVNSSFTTINKAASAINKFDSNTEATIRIGCPTNIANTVLIDFLCKFLIEYPKIKIETVTQSKEGIMSLLTSNDIDLVINISPIPIKTENIKSDVLIHNFNKVFFATKSFLRQQTQKKNITKWQLAQLPLILPSKDRKDCQKLLETLQIDLKTVIEVSFGTELIYSMVLKNLGIGYANEHYIDYNKNSEVEILSIVDVELPKSNLLIAYNKNETSKPVLAFIEKLKDFCKAQTMQSKCSG